MFTINDFERVRSNGKKSKGILDALLFTVQKSEIAYAMNLCDSHHKGTYAERLIGNKLIEYGMSVEFYGAAHDYDLLINHDIRAEVKLSTVQPYGKSSTKYIFHKIKPELFDVIFFVFLNPYGLTIKWTDSNIVNKWSTNYTRGANGYSISFNSNMSSKKISYDESIETFVSAIMT